MSHASKTLKRLIRRSGRSAYDIAREAEVDRFALARWYRGAQPSIKLDDAERVYRVLTGRRLL